MGYVIGIVVVLLVIAAIVQAAIGQDRYAKMSDKEFEEEAQRGSALGGAFLEIQNVLEPQRKVEHLLQRDKRVEGDSAEAGDKPRKES